MPTKLLAATSAALCLTITAGNGVESTLQLQLSTSSDFEQRTVQYDCGTETPFLVTYLNARPNFLAVLTAPEEIEPLVFAAVLSGSGARYAAAHWLWSTEGPDATLRDAALSEDADPVLTCSEFIDTP